jgi:hypothetical protein
MSSKPKLGYTPKGGPGKKVNAALSAIPREQIEEIKKASEAPTSQIAASPQPFKGSIQPAPARRPLPTKGPIMATAPPKKAKKAPVSTIPDLVTREGRIPEDEMELFQEQFDGTEYQSAYDYIATQKQFEESASHYKLDTQVYVPQTRKAFYKFIKDTYEDDFTKELSAADMEIDRDACRKLEQKGSDEVERFLYQQFVREYIRNASPYRGLLVYHGLGSGKTCSAIAAAEAIYGVSDKKIIVMTPLSLRENFIKEISFCGFKHLSLNNAWLSLALPELTPPMGMISPSDEITIMYAKSVLSLDDKYIATVRSKPAGQRNIWIPIFDPDVEPDYQYKTSDEQTQIRNQLHNTIENRIQFINYNGISATKIEELICTGAFNNAVVVVDEVHNMVRLMQGIVDKYLKKESVLPYKSSVADIVKDNTIPICITGKKKKVYKRGYLFYRLFTEARNTKVIGLSGTPIINFPEEVGILTNILSGYIDCIESTIRVPSKENKDKFMEIVDKHPRTDIVRMKDKGQFLVSVLPPGYKKVFDEAGTFLGVKHEHEAQTGIDKIFEELKVSLDSARIEIGAHIFKTYARLPPDYETFSERFIKQEGTGSASRDDTVKEFMLKKRLTGVVSYYRGSKEEFMPRVIKDEKVMCPFSEYAYNIYIETRTGEIEGEQRQQKKKKKAGQAENVFDTIGDILKGGNTSNYKFRSRACCNFVFPDDIPRPFPSDKILNKSGDTGNIDNIIQGEGETVVSDEDKELMDRISLEDDAVPEPEEEGVILGGADEKSVMNQLREMAAAAGLQIPTGETNNEGEEEGENEEVNEEEGVNEEEADEGNSNNDFFTKMSKMAKQAGIALPGQENEEEEEEENEEEEEVIVPPPKKKVVIIENNTNGDADEEESVVEPSADVPVAAPTPPSVKRTPLPTRVLIQESTQVDETADYTKRVEATMQRLSDEKESYLVNVPGDDTETPPENRLSTYSTKMANLITYLEKTPSLPRNRQGPHLIYSAFKTVEGLGVLGLAMEANGFEEIRIENRKFTPESIQSLKKGPDGTRRFIKFTGEGKSEERGIIIDLFNGRFDRLPSALLEHLQLFIDKGEGNKYGELCSTVMITGAGAEGISLKNVRSVHILEPFWNSVRLDQVKGRAIRICSHSDLPYEDREVEIFTYIASFTEQQKTDMQTKAYQIFLNDKSKTTDEQLDEISVEKDRINNYLLTVMKEVAIDCRMNVNENKAVIDGVPSFIKCFSVDDSRINPYMFDPDLAEDYSKTATEFSGQAATPSETTIESPVQTVRREMTASIRAPAPPPPSSSVIQAKSIKLMDATGEETTLIVDKKAKEGPLEYEMFTVKDQYRISPIGSIQLNPLTGEFDPYSIKFYSMPGAAK